MTDATLHAPLAASPEAGMGDYWALLKPRVMSLVVFTALAGLVAAPVHPHPFVALVAILCIAVGGGASGALNMWWDADIDAVMKRTRGRPVPSGRVQPQEALAVVLGGTSLFGGRGTMVGTVLGALTVAVIGNGLILAHLSPFLTPIVTGSIILVAVWMNFRIFRGAGRKR